MTILFWSDLSALVNTLEDSGPDDEEYRRALDDAWRVLEPSAQEGLSQRDIAARLWGLLQVRDTPGRRLAIVALMEAVR